MSSRSTRSLLLLVVLLTTAIAMLLLAADIGLWPFGSRQTSAAGAAQPPLPTAAGEPSADGFTRRM